MSTVYPLLFTLLSRLPAELAHQLALGGLSVSLSAPEIRALVRAKLAPAKELRVDALGLQFSGPLGLAAGFDKNGEGPDALSSLGFGFIEVGTVTAEPQAGNPPPRLFRLVSDRALLNRMGFNNEGVERVCERLERHPRDRDTIVGFNIGKSKTTPLDQASQDYLRCAKRVASLAAYCVVNVSSPNTPGLRSLQGQDELAGIMRAARAGLDQGGGREVPLLVKIAPDLSEEQAASLGRFCRELGIAGIVATNTTVSREGLQSPGVAELGEGGISGRPLRTRSLAILDALWEEVGRDLTLVSVGGIETAEDAWERIIHGATLLQVYTAFVYEGPLLPYRIQAGIAERLKREGLGSLGEAVGLVHSDGATRAPSVRALNNDEVES